jgi:hypothetical protein
MNPTTPPFGPSGTFGPISQPPAPKRSRRKAWLTYGATALVAFSLGSGIGSAGAKNGTAAAAAPADSAKPRPAVTATVTAEAAPAPTVTETVTATAKPKKTKRPGPSTSFAGDGEYLVGTDIASGTYKTAGPADSWGCYWERAKDSSGDFDSIIANNNLQGSGRVTLRKGEVFKTNGCQKWTKAG